MSEPESRQFVAFKNNGYSNPGPDELNAARGIILVLPIAFP